MSLFRFLLPILLSVLSVSGFSPYQIPVNLMIPSSTKSSSSSSNPTLLFAEQQQDDSSSSSPTSADAAPGPVLNGKRVLPFKILMAGLKGNNNVAGVYAILNKQYKRGSEGWENCEHIGVSLDLETTLKEHSESSSSQGGGGEEEGRVAHVRALTFVIPSVGAMEDVANQWRVLANEAGGRVNLDPILAAMEEVLPYAEYDDDEDDDDWDEDDDEIFEEMKMAAEAMSMARDSSSTSTSTTMAEAEQPANGSTSTTPAMEDSTTTTTASAEGEEQDVVSPFDASTQTESSSTTVSEAEDTSSSSSSSSSSLEFTKENVDKTLEEVRPYLIADGGNVSVERVDEETKNVYLKLEGACGSCPSSTVTMKMGIERVLKENFAELGDVIQVEDDDGEEKPSELTWQVVESEVNRIKPAIIAMGGVVRIVNVDPIGVVELEFRGANKVRQGLELALLDIDFVKHVKFVMGD